jgi:nitroreductase
MARYCLRAALSAALFFIFTITVTAQDIIKLPDPDTEGGIPLMQALKERRSDREFSAKELPLPVLSNLLWAAWGMNRPDGHRTAPSARNIQDIEVYAAMRDGLYIYNAEEHQLRKILNEDIRAATGNQDYVREAPLNLIYVVDSSKGDVRDTALAEFLSGAHAAFVAQNVYLFCASENLSVVVRGNIDKTALRKSMKLRPDQKITLAQSVGFPKDKK